MKYPGSEGQVFQSFLKKSFRPAGGLTNSCNIMLSYLGENFGGCPRGKDALKTIYAYVGLIMRIISFNYVSAKITATDL